MIQICVFIRIHNVIGPGPMWFLLVLQSINDLITAVSEGDFHSLIHVLQDVL